MALTAADSIWFNATSTGLGDFVAASAVSSAYRTPATAGITNGSTLHYSARTATEFENGEGVYTSGTTTLSRVTIFASSNANAKVNFGSVPAVAIAPVAEDAIFPPATSTNNAIALWSGTAGDTLQDSSITVSGSGTLSGTNTGDQTLGGLGGQPLDATLTALAGYNVNGLVTQTAADTFTGRTVTGTASQIAVANGSGVAGNPTISIDAAYVGQASITTLGTITSGTWNGTDVAFANIAQGTARSVLGVTGNATADLASIQSGATGQVLNSTATAVTWTATPSLATSLTVPTISGGSAASSALVLQSTSGAGTSDSISLRTASQTEVINIDTNSIVRIFGPATSVPLSVRAALNSNDSEFIVTGYATTGGGNVQFSTDNYNTSGVGDAFQCTYSRGTKAAQTTVLSGDTLGKITSFGYNGSTDTQATNMNFQVDAAPTSGVSTPGRITFATAASGSGSSQERLRIDSSGNVQVHHGSLGYGPAGQGVGSAVTQITSRTTTVVLNDVCGAVTLFAGAPTVGTWQSFTVTNSTVAATDTVIVSVKSATDTYIAHCTAVAAGSFRLSFTSISGTTSDSPVINFAVIKAVVS